MNTIVLASSNKGKLQELQLLLEPAGLELKLQEEFDVEDADETGLSFIENAILKARHAARHTGLPALADDSGIEVDALKGAPGIYSARFAKMHDSGAGDKDNNRLLLEKLKHVEDPDRTARFRCVLAFIRHELDPSPIIAEGSWEGRILHEAAGENGFGYDPLFHAFDPDKPSAALSKADKARLSHRGRALEKMMVLLNSTKIA